MLQLAIFKALYNVLNPFWWIDVTFRVGKCGFYQIPSQSPPSQQLTWVVDVSVVLQIPFSSPTPSSSSTRTDSWAASAGFGVTLHLHSSTPASTRKQAASFRAGIRWYSCWIATANS